jgi:hypothetical protein
VRDHLAVDAFEETERTFVGTVKTPPRLVIDGGDATDDQAFPVRRP